MEHLPSSLLRIRHALEAAADAMVITDRAGTILWVNPAFEAMTGYAADESIGRRPSLLKSGRHDERFYADLWGTIARGHVWKGEITNRRRNGAYYVEEMTITPVLDPSGDIEQYIAIKRDVSERRRIADALKTALKEAERTTEFQRRLLDNLSHEVHTPLASIIGYAEVLSAEVSNHHREFARSILQSGRRLLDTLDSLIELSTVDSGVVRYDPRWFDPVDLIRSVAEEHTWRAEARGIELEIDVASDVPARILQDPRLLDRALHHLLDNGVRYTSSGSVAVRVRRREDDVEIAVIDTGIGMAPSTLRDLFQPFHRGPADVHGGGLGVGLAIVRRLVDLMEARIKVTSEPGIGTTVLMSVRCPRATGQILSLGNHGSGPAHESGSRRTAPDADARTAGGFRSAVS